MRSSIEAAQESVDGTVELVEEFGRQWDNGTASATLLAGDRPTHETTAGHKLARLFAHPVPRVPDPVLRTGPYPALTGGKC